MGELGYKYNSTPPIDVITHDLLSSFVPLLNDRRAIWYDLLSLRYVNLPSKIMSGGSKMDWTVKC